MSFCVLSGGVFSLEFPFRRGPNKNIRHKAFARTELDKRLWHTPNAEPLNPLTPNHWQTGRAGTDMSVHVSPAWFSLRILRVGFWAFAMLVFFLEFQGLDIGAYASGSVNFGSSRLFEAGSLWVGCEIALNSFSASLGVREYL